MKFLLIFVLVIVSGCDRTVEGFEVEGYIKNCAEKGGLYLINNHDHSALCNDGDRVRWNQ